MDDHAVMGGGEPQVVPALAAVGVTDHRPPGRQIVARVGRYKALLFGSLVLLGLGLFLATGLHANTERVNLWLWMILAGVGIGPSFAVFTLIVQNAVSPARIGVATSSLTFFQQIGGGFRRRGGG